jgi:hypothetical protein
MTLQRKVNPQRYWSGLVLKAKQEVRSELAASLTDIPLEQVRDDVCGWIEYAIPSLEAWREHVDFPARSAARRDFEVKLKNLRLKLDRMRGFTKVNGALAQFLSEMTSVSLLRLQPFRRTMVWDRYHNSLLPRSFIEDRVEGVEASLATGETAFATFASGVASHRSGMVICDDLADLRGTYFLIDRIIGLGTNAFVPMREAPGESRQEPARGALLGMVTVSLPVRYAFGRKFAERLSRRLREYQDGVQLMWECEQLDELVSMNTGEYPELSDLAASLLHDLVPDAKSGSGLARLPGCAVLSGAALSRMSDAAVDIQEARFVVSPSHLSIFAQTEVEMSVYGVRDRVMTLESDFAQAWANGDYSLWVSGKPDPETARAPWHVIAEIGRIIDATFGPGGPTASATRLHRMLEAQRGLFIYLLDYVTTGDACKRRNLMMSLHCICFTPELQKRVKAVEAGLDALREWGERQRGNLAYVCVCVRAQFLSLTYPESELDYLSGFEVRPEGDARGWPLSSLFERSDVRGTYSEEVAHEIRGARRFTGWCRALSALVGAAPPAAEISEFFVKDFALYERPPELMPGQAPLAYLPSLLLPDGARLRVRHDGDAVRLDIDARGAGLRSDWLSRVSWLPLATSAYPCGTQPVKLELRLQELPAEGTLFFDFKRPQIGLRRKPWKVTASDKGLGPSPAQLIRRVANVMPHWFASIECVAAVPISTQNALKIPKWSEWGVGNGTRHLLLAGILLRKPIEWATAREDVEIRTNSTVSNLQKDPFLKRFKNLLEGAQQRQGALRRFEQHNLNTLLMTHIFHDVSNPQKLQALVQVLDNYRRLRRGLKFEKELVEAESAFEDLKQAYDLYNALNSERRCQPSLAEIESNLPEACRTAVRHAELKIRRDGEQVSASELSELLPDLEKYDPAARGPEALLILLMLDNIIRNALVGAWSYRRKSETARKETITLHTQRRDRCLVFGNKAPVNRWKRVAKLYADKTPQLNDVTGISIVRLAAELLHLKLDINWDGKSEYGEIYLHSDRE